jgi:hypothetical protein
MRYSHEDKIDTYNSWQLAQKIPINRGFFIEDLTKVEVAPWEHKGGLGAFVNLDGTGGTNDGYVRDTARKQRAKASLRGDGLCPRRTWGDSIWQKDGKKHTLSIREVSLRFRSTPTTNTSTAKAMPLPDILPSPTPRS